MIEILVTLIVVALGLLGMAGLQSRLIMSEFENYQRAQALMLLNDMSNKISSNGKNAASYVTTTPLGSGMTCPTSTTTAVDRDKASWCTLLQGAAETAGTTNVGAMVGARGCVESAGTNQYMVTVAWQGMSALSAPPSSVGCGAGLYNGPNCANDTCRRAVTTVVQVKPLTP